MGKNKESYIIGKVDLGSRKVLDFALEKPAIVDRAYFEFFGPLPISDLTQEWEDLFLEWLLFDHQQENGMSFFVEYTLKNPDQLDKNKINQFKQITETQFYSFFEVQKVEKGQWLILEDLHSGKIYKAHEKKGASIIKAPANLPGRLAKIDNRWYLIGAKNVYFPNTYTEKTKKNLREMKIKKYSPQDTFQILKGRDQKNQPPPPKVTKKQIKAKRKKLRKDYEKCLEKYNISLSFDDLTQAIYEENGGNFINFWQEMIDNGLTEKFFKEKHLILQDVWNYFPHRCLNDMSPVEAYNKAKGKSRGVVEHPQH